MNPVQILGGLLAGLANYLQAKRTQASIQAAFDVADAVNAWLARTITAIAQVMSQQAGAVRFSAQAARQIGKDLETIEGNTETRFGLVRDMWLPHSLAFLEGRLYQQAIVPLRRQVSGLIAQVQSLVDRIVRLERWRQSWVDPAIANWYGVRNTYLDAWRTLRGWLARPGEFGRWAAAPVTGPIIAYLADPDHQTSRDNLAAIMVDAWQAEPERVWDAMLAWLVS